MFGLVKREQLLECEKGRVELRLQVMRLEKTLGESAQENQRLAGELALADRHIGMLERERDLLLQAVASRAAVQAVPASAEPALAPVEHRSLTGFEAVVRATEYRNSQAATPVMPRVTEIFANASRQRRAEASRKAAQQQETGTGA